METQTHNPKQSISKYNHYKGQKQRVFEALNKNPKTMLMLSVETGIMRANICRFVSKWRRENKIEVCKIDLCLISKHKAGYYHVIS